MIFTPASVVYGFLAFLGVLTGGALLALALRTLLRTRTGEREPETALAAGLALGQATLIIRLVSWPCLYWMLKSWVPVTPGAMCIFGVTQSAPWLTRTLQFLEPMALLVAGAVFLILGAYRAGGQGVTARQLLAHLAAGGGLGAITSTVSLALLFVPKETREVSCCSTIFADPTPLQMAAGGLLGGWSAQLFLALTQSVALAFLAVQLWRYLQPEGRAWRSGLGVVLALVHAPLAVFAAFEALAPVLLGKPAHHCLYCLTKPHWFNTLATLSALLLLGLATFLPLWMAWLNKVVPARPRASRLWPVVSMAALVAFWTLALVPYYWKLP
jgi:hypothetical protein